MTTLKHPLSGAPAPLVAALPVTGDSRPAPLLQVRDLRVSYRTRRGTRTAVRGITFDLARGETLALVGESGSGKSTTALALNGMLPTNAHIDAGQVLFDGQDLTRLRPRALRRLRGVEIGLIPQDPATSLNPTMKIGAQIAETLLVHGLADRRTVRPQVVQLLDQVGIDHPERRARQLPHELSGGMRQRVLIAIAIAGKPQLVIADEPTSALDATVSRKVLDHIATLGADLGISVLLITHDLAMAAERADRIVVLENGLAVEQGDSPVVLRAPEHPYTRALLSNAPSLRSGSLTGRTAPPPREPGAAPVLEVRSLSKTFGRGEDATRAVDDVSFTLGRGETLSILGESGSGKSTTARMILGLETQDSGQVLLDGTDVVALSRAERRDLRRSLQIIYQNPYASLNPRFTVEQTIAEPLRAFGLGDRTTRARLVAEMADAVALPRDTLRRHPRELSGGQRQRVAIARALVLEPRVVVCDEPVSALDVTVQAQILELLVRLQKDLGVSYVFISHDLSVVRQISDQVLVMRRGVVLERGTTAEVFTAPQDTYTQELLDAVPDPLHQLHPLTAIAGA